MRIPEIGEFALIDRIVEQLGEVDASVLVGPGDDTAVIRPSPDAALLATCDTQVEGRHFSRAQINAEQIGRRLAAVNLSDIAAMGGQPRWALASFALPDGIEAGFVEDCVRGLADELRRFGAQVVGGNLTGSATLILDLTLLGEAQPSSLLGRSGARPGDVILLTGDLGAAAAGRLALEAHLPRAEAESCIARHLEPRARIEAGQAIAATGLAHAMIDISDGLAQDLGHICDASRVDAVLHADALPVGDLTRRIAAALGSDPTSLALSGGEDYELLCTAAEADAQALIDAVLAAASLPLTPIGRITPPDQGRWLRLANGDQSRLDHRGWQHFGPRPEWPV